MKNLVKHSPYLVLPVLISVIASFQLIKAETTSLTRWKGGGFGMYTDIHRSYYAIVVNGEVYNSSHQCEYREVTDRVIKNFIFNPSAPTATQFYRYLETEEDSIQLQLYEPVMDAKRNMLTYKLAYEHTFSKDK